MDKTKLSIEELDSIRPGEPISLAAVIAIMAIGLLAVAIYRIFMSDSGNIKLPGGYQFQWS